MKLAIPKAIKPNIARRLSAKGPITIPAEARAALRLQAGDLVSYEIREGEIALKRVDPFDCFQSTSVREFQCRAALKPVPVCGGRCPQPTVTAFCAPRPLR